MFPLEAPPSSPFFPFSLPFLDDDDLLHSLSMIHNAPPPNYHDHQKDHTKNVISNNVDDKKMMRQKKKKDRHSKICTAHGVRDRRMRLSVKVARKFFDLQDMLDFDKGSKTIEWLLINSQAAIQKLQTQSQLLPNWHNMISSHENEKSLSSSAASVSEVLSETYNKEVMEAKPKKKRKTCRAVNPLARESRDKARARARERTIEKIMIQRSHNTLSSGFTHAIGDHMDATTIEPTSGCYAMTSKNMNPNLQEHSNRLPSTSPPSSIFMTISSNHGHWSNPSSFFVPAPNTQDHQQNPIPNPFFLSTESDALEGITNSAFSATSSNFGFESHHFLGNQFQ